MDAVWHRRGGRGGHRAGRRAGRHHHGHGRDDHDTRVLLPATRLPVRASGVGGADARRLPAHRPARLAGRRRRGMEAGAFGSHPASGRWTDAPLPRAAPRERLAAPHGRCSAADAVSPRRRRAGGHANRPQEPDFRRRQPASHHGRPVRSRRRRHVSLDSRRRVSAGRDRQDAPGGSVHARRVRRAGRQARRGAVAGPRRPQRPVACRRRHEDDPRGARGGEQLLGSAAVRRPRRLRHARGLPGAGTV